MSNPAGLLVFSLDERRLALPLESVERVFRMVEVTPLPDAPPSVVGIINLQGRIVPVIDLRSRLRLSPRALEVNDRLIVAQAAGRSVALVVDRVQDIVNPDEGQITSTEQLGSANGSIAAVARADQDIILIQDLNRLLAADESERLDQALGTI